MATTTIDEGRSALARDLFGRLWGLYRSRVPYVRVYASLLAEAGGRFLNDHVAFRTIACQEPPAGIFTVSRVFEALGYVPAGCYNFPDTLLSSIHYRHGDPGLPKVFVSELRSWELSPESRRTVLKSMRRQRDGLQDGVLAALRRPAAVGASERRRLLRALVGHFSERPWDPPARAAVEALNCESQFAAWVLLRGYDVNHFTASVDAHGCAALSDIEKTVAALKAAGVPMKAQIEGERGSKLRQSATEAVVTDVTVMDKGRRVRIPWTYAYFELAERGLWTNPETGRQERFEGFLGPQARQLFEMTRLKGPGRAIPTTASK